MLEDIAIKFVSLPDEDLKAIGFGIVTLGAVAAGFLKVKKSWHARLTLPLPC
jgi:hypothetical protein